MREQHSPGRGAGGRGAALADGPMLGVFLVGFFFRKARGTPVFFATLLAQAAVLATFFAS